MTEQPRVEKFFSVSEIDEMLSKGHIADFKYTLSDTILFLLMAHDKPIRGKTKQMKEVFLMLKEILAKESQPVYFIKHRLGPYSEEVEYTIADLVASNYISASGKKSNNEFAISLTDKGLRYIQQKYNELPPVTRGLLKRKRLEWDTHISQGILKLVYTHYDEYLEKSVLKRRYQKLDWDDDNQRMKEK